MRTKTPSRTGLGVVRQLAGAYGDCWPRLREHDSRFPSPETLLTRTVPGYDDTDEGVQLVMRAVDADDPRPVWFLNWGTIDGSAKSCLRRRWIAFCASVAKQAMPRLREYPPQLRRSIWRTHDAARSAVPAVGRHLPSRAERKRWYHRFSGLTATAGGFDIEARRSIGPRPTGHFYPTNTTHPQKEGDTMTFLYLVPNGLGDPNEPTWGSWAGRYGNNPAFPGKPYFHANQQDTWNGTAHRENTLALGRRSAKRLSRAP